MEIDQAINAAMRAVFAIERNLHLGITYEKVEEVEGNDYHGNVTKRFKIYIRYPNGIVNDFTIDESFLYKPEDAMTLYGVYKWVKPYFGKIPNNDFIILCLARWFLEVGKEWKYI